MKTILNGNTEIRVTAKIYGSYSIKNLKLVIYKGYKTNIYYLTYANVVIMQNTGITTLLDSFDDYINMIDGLDNKMRCITDKVKKPLYRVITKDNETISIYKSLKESDSLELLETSEIHGGRYAIFRKENEGYAFGLSLEAAIYIFKY